MRKFRYFLLLTSYFLLLMSCKNNHAIDNREINKKSEIIHLQDTYYYKYYLFENFQENEQDIKYLIDFLKKTTGDKWVLTNINGVEFEDNYAILDVAHQRFSINNNLNKFYYIKVNFLESTPIHFTTKETENQTDLTADFETLTVNTVQNFLDYAEKDEAKKDIETYTYILYNKSSQEKMKLIYHEYGNWFEVEVF
ncbi:hypothetical protein [uncultured Apibacter sp.]|uniref:hypothetical protein n=1 Tax=uncultured Apibacter sp. TaxID=1778616 RepID=UPI0025D313F1|nr:hypothetical protein [uncultured Apibacter sp.]